MTLEQLAWFSGLSLAVGGGLAMVGWLLFAVFDPAHRAYEKKYWLPFNFLIIGGGFFMALGLPGFYALQAEQSGIVGFAGFVIFYAGILFGYLAVHSIETMTVPDVPRGIMIIVLFAAPSLFVGGILTAYATWRAAVYPIWVPVGLVFSMLLALVTQNTPIPAWIGRNVAPAVFALTMGVTGILVMLIST